MKFLNDKEINTLIEALENGDIIIDSHNKSKMTEKEMKEYKKLKKERYNALNINEKDEINKLVKRLRKEDASSI